MKWALAIALLLTLGAGTGMAEMLVVDFSSLGITSHPIDVPGGYTLGGVNFFFDNAGGTDTAAIASNGITIFSGTGSGLTGVLDLTFPSFMRAMTFNFLVGADIPQVFDPGAIVILGNGIDSLVAVTDASGIGTASLSAVTAFTTANVLLAPDPNAVLFQMSSLSSETVPEPSTCAFLGYGLLLLGFGSRMLAKRRS